MRGTASQQIWGPWGRGNEGRGGFHAIAGRRSQHNTNAWGGHGPVRPMHGYNISSGARGRGAFGSRGGRGGTAVASAATRVQQGRLQEMDVGSPARPEAGSSAWPEDEMEDSFGPPEDDGPETHGASETAPPVASQTGTATAGQSGDICDLGGLHPTRHVPGEPIQEETCMTPVGGLTASYDHCDDIGNVYEPIRTGKHPKELRRANAQIRSTLMSTAMSAAWIEVALDGELPLRMLAPSQNVALLRIVHHFATSARPQRNTPPAKQTIKWQQRRGQPQVRGGAGWRLRNALPQILTAAAIQLARVLQPRDPQAPQASASLNDARCLTGASSTPLPAVASTCHRFTTSKNTSFTATQPTMSPSEYDLRSQRQLTALNIKAELRSNWPDVQFAGAGCNAALVVLRHLLSFLPVSHFDVTREMEERAPLLALAWIRHRDLPEEVLGAVARQVEALPHSFLDMMESEEMQSLFWAHPELGSLDKPETWHMDASKTKRLEVTKPSALELGGAGLLHMGSQDARDVGKCIEQRCALQQSGEGWRLQFFNTPLFIRLRYSPGDTHGSGYDTLSGFRVTPRSPNEERRVVVAHPPVRYRLVASVRLGMSDTCSDAVRIYKFHGKPVRPPFSVSQIAQGGIEYVDDSWALGRADYDYMVFYVRCDEDFPWPSPYPEVPPVQRLNLLREELRKDFWKMADEMAAPPADPITLLPPRRSSRAMRAPTGPRAMTSIRQATSRAQAGPDHPVSIPTQPRAMAARQEMDGRSGGKRKREAEPDTRPRISHRGFIMPEEGPPPKRHRAEETQSRHHRVGDGYGSGDRGGPSYEDPRRVIVKEEE
ncbi:hypothetical protein MAPG_04867 [Magnaporthiopsis poae ATCC 64411]|uniref:Uncharacterized protein n=1 Tax=Magnaporthiopsis poae (strain ATCC 64411 / 73-15) TaxID=644358 RepID=A0A0C4DXW0_MAGP6|nr:hypothetical protein MAPG_04867 [Magnaporthiopsis poae ATCC 64411]